MGNDRQFAKFCEIAGCPELAADERFATNANRIRNREVLVPLLQEVLPQRTTQEWVAPLEAAGVPSGPINNLAQAFEHPQVKHRGMKIELPHPQAGTVPSVANPIKFSDTPITYRSAPPLLGQHTKKILSTLGGCPAVKSGNCGRKALFNFGSGRAAHAACVKRSEINLQGK